MHGQWFSNDPGPDRGARALDFGDLGATLDGFAVQARRCLSGTALRVAEQVRTELDCLARAEPRGQAEEVQREYAIIRLPAGDEKEDVVAARPVHATLLGEVLAEAKEPNRECPTVQAGQRAKGSKDKRLRLN